MEAQVPQASPPVMLEPEQAAMSRRTARGMATTSRGVRSMGRPRIAAPGARVSVSLGSAAVAQRLQIACRPQPPDVVAACLVGVEVDPPVVPPARGAAVGVALGDLDEGGAVGLDGEE